MSLRSLSLMMALFAPRPVRPCAHSSARLWPAACTMQQAGGQECRQQPAYVFKLPCLMQV